MSDPRQTKRQSTLWIDHSDALSRNQQSSASDVLKNAATSIIRDGIVFFEQVVEKDLCQEVIADYKKFTSDNKEFVDLNRDELGREKRLVNFHLKSEAASKIATNPILMEFLDYIYDEEAGPYTSLTFKYGTQQPIHRDTPHFSTWPLGRFNGVWVALEDISPDAGPLMYHPGGHRFVIDQHEIWQHVQAQNPGAPMQEAVDMALEVYNGRVIDWSKQAGEPVVVPPLRQGDAVVWHAELPHGGSPALNPMATRFSMVTHCAPVSTQVHQHPDFFRHVGPEGPAPRYGYEDAHGRKVAVAGDVSFM